MNGSAVPAAVTERADELREQLGRDRATEAEAEAQGKQRPAWVYADGTARHVRLQEAAVAVLTANPAVPVIDAGSVKERVRSGKRHQELDDGRKVIAVVWDGWRKYHRVLVDDGRCVTCERRTGAFTDGENDPRGPLGDHAGSRMDAADEFPDDVEEHDRVSVAQCFACANEEPTYRAARAILAERVKRYKRTFRR